VVDAKRGQFWVQAFYAGQALTAPAALEPEAVSLALTDDRPEVLVGSGAGRFACSLPGVRTDPRTAADPAAIARLATVAPEPTAPPRPLYLRAPDAKLPGGVTPGA
jgi:tRNA threonylcarbamoyladenosine biosynthesis protein TsaB